ncbi:MAG: hypothetical protein FWG17_05420 [Desulfovibrionaceae bacterium]|nr:hypothetical protein [Desulfovibrionaceae bacterium]
MAQLTISASARAVGKDRSTLKRYISAGRLSVSKSVTGQPQIDVAELMRVFGELKSDGGVKIPETHSPDQALHGAMEVLNRQLQSAQERESWLKSQLETALERIRALEGLILPLEKIQETRKNGKHKGSLLLTFFWILFFTSAAVAVVGLGVSAWAWFFNRPTPL